MNQIKSIMELAKTCKILYVEDDAQTQKAMGEILTTLFEHVYIASDGEEGLKLFQEQQFDLIISDINMPKMNGIEMVAAIRSVNSEIPIMIISAYNDKEYLLDSIFLGIDRYVVKPLDDKVFFKNLHVILKVIHQKREAAVYRKERILSQINEASLNMLKETADIYPSPTFIFKESGGLEFMNSAASRLFSKEELSSFLEDGSLDDFIVKKSGYLKSIEDAKSANKKEAKLIMKIADISRIFMVTHSHLDSKLGTFEVIGLTDITRVEYEKQKSQNLSAYLHDLLRSMRKNISFTAESDDIKPVKEPDLLSTEIIKPKATNEAIETNYDYIRLSAMHPTSKKSAKEYITNLSSEVMDELDEMRELESEMKDTLAELEEHFGLSSLHSLAMIFARYGRMISLLMDFEDISYSMENLSEFLLSLTTTEWNQKKMLILLQAISDDLIQWREVIFVTQETNDIHYLDASLLSSCLQIKMDFGEKGVESEGNELELF